MNGVGTPTFELSHATVLFPLRYDLRPKRHNISERVHLGFAVLKALSRTLSFAIESK